MSKKIKLEVLIATPPTSKCEETMENLREIVRRFPEETSLVIFKRGIDFMPEDFRLEEFMTAEDYLPKEEPSLQMRVLITKGRSVPTVIVDGELFCACEVPEVDKLNERVEEILYKKAKIKSKN